MREKVSPIINDLWARECLCVNIAAYSNSKQNMLPSRVVPKTRRLA